MKRFFEHYLSETYHGEDSRTLKLERNVGLSKEEIARYEGSLGIRLPNDFHEMLQFSDGMNFFEERILSTSEQEFISSGSLLTFHDWGNGDFDAIVVESKTQSMLPSGFVVFICHESGCIEPVTGSLRSWFRLVLEEIKIRGTLLHPDDYHIQNSQEHRSSLAKKFSDILHFSKYTRSTDEDNSQILGLYAGLRERMNELTNSNSVKKKLR